MTQTNERKLQHDTYTSCDSVENGEKASCVLLAWNATEELCGGKLCCPETVIKVECYLVISNA